MNAVATLARWIARILSGAIIVFVGVFVAAYFIGGNEPSTGPLNAADYLAIIVSLTILAGLAISWKWEIAGGVVTLLACLAFAIFNSRVFAGMGTTIPLTAALFLISGYTRKRFDLNAKIGSSDSSD